MSLRRAFTILTFAAALRAASVGAAPQQDASSLFSALESPVISGEIDPPALLAVGRAVIRPGAGAHVFVMSASGRPCGVLIDGSATLTYTVDETLSVPLARRNASRAHGLALQESGSQATLSGTLKGTAVWGWDIDKGLGAPRPASTKLPEWLATLLEKKTERNPGRDMVLSASSPAPGYRLAIFHLADDDLRLNVNPASGVRTESLGHYWKLPAISSRAGWLVVEPIVSQPIGRRWWDLASPDIAASDTEIKVVNDDGEHGVITTRTKVQALADHVDMLQLELLSEWVTARDERRLLKITKLTIDGTPASSLQLDWNLLVTLPRPLSKGQSITLEVTTEGRILELPEGDNYWELGTDAWYPRPAWPGAEWAAFHISVTTPSRFVPFAGGDVIQPPTASNGNTIVTELKGPMQYATAVAGRYKTVTDERDGWRVHVSTYAASREAEAHRLAGVVHAVRACLENALGVPYPFHDLEVVEINDWGWGQAPPGMIFITKEALLSNASAAMLDEDVRPMAELTSRGINERIAHEVAHGWFPHVAKIVSREESWLSESFAEYASAVCIQRASADTKRGKFLFDRQVSGWKTRTSALSDPASVYLAEYLGGREADVRDRQRLLYGKGPLVLHALRQELARTAGDEKEGDRLFFTWLRSYIKNFTYKLGGTRHLVAILTQMTGKDWQPWFERYVYGTETPKVN
jgi:hypothetical protein